MNRRTEHPRGRDLVSLLYRSAATSGFDRDRLPELVDDARRRNHERGVTGALYFSQGHFLQWLEGPANELTQLFGSIGRDRRHDDIRLLSYGGATERVFGDWDLRMFRTLEEVPLVCLDGGRARTAPLTAAGLEHAALDLARGDATAFSAALEQVGPGHREQVVLCERLARSYAALWSRDHCSEWDTVAGLALARARFRLSRAGHVPPELPGSGVPILVATLPGERHALGATLAEAVLNAGGHAARLEHPSTSAELEVLLSLPCAARVVLVTSSVFTARFRLAELRAAADRIRSAHGPLARIALYGRLAAASIDLRDTGCTHHCHAALTLPGAFGGVIPTLH